MKNYKFVDFSNHFFFQAKAFHLFPTYPFFFCSIAFSKHTREINKSMTIQKILVNKSMKLQKILVNKSVTL